ncbi:Cytochrome c oxidase subunit IV [Filimonas lacunae]|uniref:Cytochrome c oxidase subunit IV n=1 Tax=Filimonas lacunae TaxID=477680 RepID=A0A173MQY0_9BACT|nr:cytochrome C oxidase subunit IV family protein [Filimonas lacunae]BAV09791.1 hypothetical protein FLA_5844 [Filimonas lacunae]SIS78996.1 Cytochrome c oxidase subunit IV [Filimonas lacunae]
MEHTSEVLHHEGHVHHDAEAGKKEVKKITLYLSVLTILELIVGYYMYSAKIEEGAFRSFLKTLIIIMMMWKATYIVGYFMHLKHEIRNFLMTIVVPLFLFIWFIIAFLADGHSYNNLRNKYDKAYVERSKMKMEVKEHESHEKEHAAGEEKTGELH